MVTVWGSKAASVLGGLHLIQVYMYKYLYSNILKENSVKSEIKTFSFY